MKGPRPHFGPLMMTRRLDLGCVGMECTINSGSYDSGGEVALSHVAACGHLGEHPFVQ